MIQIRKEMKLIEDLMNGVDHWLKEKENDTVEKKENVQVA